MNGRSVPVQLMCKLLARGFVWDVQFPCDFQENFLVLQQMDAA